MAKYKLRERLFAGGGTYVLSFKTERGEVSHHLAVADDGIFEIEGDQAKTVPMYCFATIVRG